jgi:type II secretion system protein I
MRFESIGSPGASRSPDLARGSGRRAGFTLLEALCALAVSSLALVALLQAFSDSHRGLTNLEDHFMARILARSLLAGESGGDPAFGARSGHFRQYQWTVDVRPATGNWFEPAADDRWQLYHVAVIVAWPPGGRLEVETLRLGDRR